MAQIFGIPIGKKAETRAAYNPYKPAPGTSIYFDGRLIDQLKGDHRQLMQLMQSIQEGVQERDFEAIRDLMGEFRTTLQAHLLTENVKLYVYLSRQLANNRVNIETVNTFRAEMRGIGRKVMDFLRRFADVTLTEEQVSGFSLELESVRDTLVRRIKREEAGLYPLYLPRY
jgi:tRNA/tmRNA/rRNA uracil-C5-methylase (TrmA/RlmC/RlmD family)